MRDPISPRRRFLVRLAIALIIGAVLSGYAIWQLLFHDADWRGLAWLAGFLVAIVLGVWRPWRRRS